MKYNIMYNYSGNEFNFYTEEVEPKDFETVGEAIDFAMELGYSAKFIIVNVIDYKKLILSILSKLEE